MIAADACRSSSISGIRHKPGSAEGVAKLNAAIIAATLIVPRLGHSGNRGKFLIHNVIDSVRLHQR